MAVKFTRIPLSTIHVRRQWNTLLDVGVATMCNRQHRYEGAVEMSLRDERAVLGLFDGTFGGVCAQRVSASLVPALAGLKGIANDVLDQTCAMADGKYIMNAENEAVAECGARGVLCIVEKSKDVTTKDGGAMLWMAGIGDSRGYVLRADAETCTPLTVDHRTIRPEERARIELAGGKVNLTTERIDDRFGYDISRSFGHASMKANDELSPNKQKMIPVPEVHTTIAGPDDLIILANFGTFCRHIPVPTPLDDIAHCVRQGLARGLSIGHAAAAAAQLALRAGSRFNVTVTAARVLKTPILGPDGTMSGSSQEIIPGALYMMAMKDEGYRALWQHDCARMGISPARWLAMRWEYVKDSLPDPTMIVPPSHTPLDQFGMESGQLWELMRDEAKVFEGGPAPELARDDPRYLQFFQDIVDNLPKPDTRFPEIEKQSLEVLRHKVNMNE